MLASLLSPDDFKRLLATRPRGRSAHFVLHHLSALPSHRSARFSGSSEGSLSTDSSQKSDVSVDKSPGNPRPGLSPGPEAPERDLKGRLWLGCVVPKRLARRAVTRNLIKRQMREAVRLRQQSMHPGLWLIRLRESFAAPSFPSAASKALRKAARDEIEQMLCNAAGPAR